jgi:exonuclease III
MDPENILVWNVQGLNAKEHRDALRELIVSERLSVVCLQEIKLVVISNYDVIQMIGTGFDYIYLSAAQTRGGVLVMWRTTTWSTSSTDTRDFSVSVRLR